MKRVQMGRIVFKHKTKDESGVEEEGKERKHVCISFCLAFKKRKFKKNILTKKKRKTTKKTISEIS